MARHSHISSLEDLHKWFMHLGKAKWNLYRGHQEQKRHGSIITKQDDDTVNVEVSWDLLRSMIEMNSANGGQFTVYIPQTTNGNQGASVFVSINMAQYAQRTSSLGGHTAVGMIPVEQVQKELDRERRIWELERNLEDIQASQEAGLGINDIFKEQLRTIDFGPILAGIVAHFTQQPAGVQLQGTPADQEEAPEQGTYAYDGYRIKPALDLIRPHFTDDEKFYGFLMAVAQAFAQNPDFLKQQFGYD